MRLENASEVLLVEDNPRLAALIQVHLRNAGFRTSAARSVSRFRQLRERIAARLYIIDLGLPDGDGIQLIEHCRAIGDSTPILVVTARAGVDDRVAGLDCGADDYLIKPFDSEELVARVKALLRRSAAPVASRSESRTIVKVGRLECDLDSELVYLDGRTVPLRPSERRLLCLLARRHRNVVTRDRIEHALYSVGDVTGNAVEQTVSRLRGALKREETHLVIRTEWGTGYVLEETT